MLDIKKLLYFFAGATILAGVVGLVAFAIPATAQEKSVNPGINNTYQDPDLKNMISVLEREERAIYKYRHAIVAALDLEQDLEVADVGSGTGFFTRMIAQEVGSNGKVYAVDIAQTSLDHVEKAAKEEGITNITTVLGEHKTTHLAGRLCRRDFPLRHLPSLRVSRSHDGVHQRGAPKRRPPRCRRLRACQRSDAGLLLRACARRKRNLHG